MDNYATYKDGPQLVCQAPTLACPFHPDPSASWQVERFFGLLTERQLRRGAYASRPPILNEPSTPAIVNDDPKPFRWTGR